MSKKKPLSRKNYTLMLPSFILLALLWGVYSGILSCSCEIGSIKFIIASIISVTLLGINIYLIHKWIKEKNKNLHGNYTVLIILTIIAFFLMMLLYRITSSLM